MKNVVATARTHVALICIIALLIIPFIALLLQIYGNGLETSMYFRIYGNFLYLLVYLGPLPLLWKQILILKLRNRICEEINGEMYFLGKRIDVISDILIKRTNVFGKRIEIIAMNKRHIMYQYIINENIEDVKNSINRIMSTRSSDG
jgi:hypothetical protein